jgi:hypothetical protein
MISTVRTTKAIIMIGPKIMPYQCPGDPSHQPYIMTFLLVGQEQLLNPGPISLLI